MEMFQSKRQGGICAVSQGEGGFRRSGGHVPQWGTGAKPRSGVWRTSPPEAAEFILNLILKNYISRNKTQLLRFCY